MAIFLGADPELFVEKGNGDLFPAFEFMGSKENPDPTEDGNGAYWDGFQAEYNITASPYIQECISSFRAGLKAVLKKARSKDPKANLSSKTVFPVDLDYLDSLKEEYTAFGCMPSYNVYRIRGVRKDGRYVPHRFAGGHIHFGVGKLSTEQCIEVIKSLDAILGVACVSLFENIDDPIRRKYYGLAGEHRLPLHGIEYRTLSNAWLFDPVLAANILDFSRRVVLFALNGGRSKWIATDSEVIETILRQDVVKARDILSRNLSLLEDLSASINYLQPVESSIPNIRNIEHNWGL